MAEHKSTYRTIRYFICLLFVTFLLPYACHNPEFVPEIYEPTSAYEAYTLGLEKSGLAQTALAKDWITVGNKAVQKPIPISIPHTETLHFDKRRATAYGYRIQAKNGQTLKLSVEQGSNAAARLFFDLYRLGVDSLTPYVHVATADTSHSELAFEIFQDGDYIIRIQSELLRGGNYTFYARLVPSLEFPIVRGDNNDIGGRFGDPRDGGKRMHHGIDIFARRHTPIIAPTDGYIRSAGAREGLGGNVVWMGDDNRKQTLYFAHLQEVWVESHTSVQKGDTLGTVGNSGNAIRTAPHLHFGIYTPEGPVDPYPYVAYMNNRKRKVRLDLNLLGKSVIIGDQSAIVIGATRDKYRVEDAEGSYSFMSDGEITSYLAP